MAYLNTTDRTTKTTSNEKFQPLGRMNTLTGVFMGFVKASADIQYMGRLQVWIPEFGSAPDDESGWITVNYCSPFAGATNDQSISGANLQDFNSTQTSYGLWMVPPDINNQVLVMFINGDSAKGIWIGSLYNQFVNNMVPGNKSDPNNYQYNGKTIPVAEYNKNNRSVTHPDAATKPYNSTKFKGISNQGLINDNVRAINNASARRESPSQVFGISTPGPIIDSTKPFDESRRKGGSALVMDDSPNNEYVQYTTKSGAQIQINETNGFVYLINRDGTSWVQMDKAGNIDIFGAGDISMRAQRDFNVRADRNINLEAGQNVFVTAAQDTTQTTTPFTYNVNNVPKTVNVPFWNYVGQGNGSGGNIVFQALNDMHSTTKNNVYLTTLSGNLNVSANGALAFTSVTSGIDINADIGLRLTAGGSTDIASAGNIRMGTDGSMSLVATNDIIACTSGNLNLKSSGSILAASANVISLTSSNVDVVGETTFGNDIFIVGETVSQGGFVGMIDMTSSATVDTPPDANLAVAQAAQSAGFATAAEVKPLNDKINILSTWKSSLSYPAWQSSLSYRPGDIVTQGSTLYIANSNVPASIVFNSVLWSIFIPDDKFIRNSLAMQTTVSRLPTFEPCPEHDQFITSNIAGYKPVLTPDDNSYQGSAGSGNDASTIPAGAVNPGASNTVVPADPATDTQVAKDINLNAFRCQLSIHEGIKPISYADTKGLATAGIGHLLRANEIALYPIGTPISAAQIETWYQSDSLSAIKIAENLVGDVWSVLSDIRKRALADLAYNLGPNKLAKFTNFIKLIQSQNFVQAGIELTTSAWYGQVGKRGPNIVAMITKDIDPNGCDVKFKV